MVQVGKTVAQMLMVTIEMVSVLGPRSILKLEPMVFSDELDVGCEGKKGQR